MMVQSQHDRWRRVRCRSWPGDGVVGDYTHPTYCVYTYRQNTYPLAIPPAGDTSSPRSQAQETKP
jgi:hypothetical protein